MSDNLFLRAAGDRGARVKTRRDLHGFPELDRIEFRTASIVAERLKALGLEIKLGREVIGCEPDGTIVLA
jgi:aminobenzoyl-glutamate utilization protein A